MKQASLFQYKATFGLSPPIDPVMQLTGTATSLAIALGRLYSEQYRWSLSPTYGVQGLHVAWFLPESPSMLDMAHVTAALAGRPHPSPTATPCWASSRRPSTAASSTRHRPSWAGSLGTCSLPLYARAPLTL